MMERTPAAGSAFPHLFSPISLGRVALRNRTVFQPHFTALGGLDGMPTDDLAAYHEERARGGVGLIVTESHAIHPTGKMSARFINAYDPAVIPGFTKITTCVHEHGAIIFGQLTHGGHTSLEHPPHVMWAPLKCASRPATSTLRLWTRTTSERSSPASRRAPETCSTPASTA